MAGRLIRTLRVLLSSYVTTGMSAGFGVMLIAGSGWLLLGQFGASVMAVGAIICVPPDHAMPRRGKLSSLLPAAIVGLPLFDGV